MRLSGSANEEPVKNAARIYFPASNGPSPGSVTSQTAACNLQMGVRGAKMRWEKSREMRNRPRPDPVMVDHRQR